MSCLAAPQFKWPSPLHSLHPKARDSVCSRTQCALSPPSVVEIEHIPTLEAHSTYVSRPLKYAATVGPPGKASIVATLATESLLTCEEAVIAAAAAEAVALARAAVEIAKVAALKAGKNTFAESHMSDLPSTSTRIPSQEMVRITETKWISHSHIVEPFKDNATKDPSESTDVSTLAFNEPNIQEIYNSIAVKSERQTERRTRRARAAEKPAGAISRKSGKKKRSSIQPIDYSDPLRYFRGTTNSSKLLSVAEELELSEAIQLTTTFANGHYQHLLSLERLKKELVERNGGEPTFAQWAGAAGVDQKTLRKHLSHGRFCKDKMIKSNIRLVISIAKNFQNAGLNLQDLVLEGCKGLVRGAEKFDASKGFKFSTYAHWWIKQAIRRSLSEQSRIIRLPFHMVEANYRVREARKQLYSENKKYPDNEEVARITGLPLKRVEAVLLTRKAPISLDQKTGFNLNLKPSEIIADPEAETSEDILIKHFMKEELHKVLDTLNPREKQVMRLRFGLENGRMKTLQEIGELMGISRERVRQIESCAFRKLKSKRRTRSLQQYLIS
ncbi:hypothetical protein ZIOFF_042183 [Zingiber officinale]|uniref:RNA polymerase sigma factor n=1 Tax=Zingiber officinale TaxID=94328 RepID=A0A8J5GK11_ZINOF|nr:hypothetical protein ZIOFF_042183 [Zingiber officinale]